MKWRLKRTIEEIGKEGEVVELTMDEYRAAPFNSTMELTTEEVTKTKTKKKIKHEADIDDESLVRKGSRD